MAAPAFTQVTGGCHCKAVRFRAAVPVTPEVWRCNCSICTPFGFLHLFVPHEQFTLVSGDDGLTSYRFGTLAAEHLFCSTCGVKSFYQPRSHPDEWSVHLLCLDPGHDLQPHFVEFDGKNWEHALSER